MLSYNRSLFHLFGIFAILLTCSVMASAQVSQSSDSGSFVINGTVSSFVEVRAGGNATLTGAIGGTGSITGQKSKGDALDGLVINLGEVGPMNTNPFVMATVPLRLRSNINYLLTMTSVTTSSNSNTNALKASDIGVGIDLTGARSDPGVQTDGTDTAATGLSGNPTLDSAANTELARWSFSSAKSISSYIGGAQILSGSPIMAVQPKSYDTSGLTFNTFYCVKPQFFETGTFSTTVTMTITAAP